MAKEETKQEVGEPIVEQGEVSPEQIKELEEGKYVSIKRIATELSYTTAWILELVHKGRIKGIKPLGGRWRIPRSEYERIIKEGIPPMSREPTEKPPVTEIAVVEEKVIDKVKEAPVSKEPPGIFPFRFGRR